MSMRKVFFGVFAGVLAVAYLSGSICYAGKTEVISVDIAGKLGNGQSAEPAISADGRYIAFRSSASNLVPDDTNGKDDIFVHDRKTGETTIISKNNADKLGNDGSSHPAISADGRYVAFQSSASNLVTGDINDKMDIFVHDRRTGKTKIISKGSAGKLGNNDSSKPAISADGRYVAFQSLASNLVPGDINDKMDIFVHDRLTGKTKIISKDSAGKLGNNDSSNPAISADGRYVAFQSSANNLTPGDTNDKTDVFVHDRRTGQTTLISKDSAGKLGNNDSSNPAISADGRVVPFRSSASNLAPGDTNDKTDVYVHDRRTGQTTLISKDSAGKAANGASDIPFISADGRFVAFQSDANNLVPGDTNGQEDAFIHDLQTGVTEIVSTDSNGIQGNAGGCFTPSISGDGRYVAFETEAGNLVPGDTNGVSDVFVRDRR